MQNLFTWSKSKFIILFLMMQQKKIPEKTFFSKKNTKQVGCDRNGCACMIRAWAIWWRGKIDGLAAACVTGSWQLPPPQSFPWIRGGDFLKHVEVVCSLLFAGCPNKKGRSAGGLAFGGKHWNMIFFWHKKNIMLWFYPTDGCNFLFKNHSCGF